MSCKTLFLLFPAFCFPMMLRAQTFSAATAIHGREYLRIAYYIAKGIAYFETDTLRAGSVTYNKVSHQAPLLFDQIEDKLLTPDPTGKNLIELVKERVDSFEINNALFVRLNGNYYQSLYNGRRRLVKQDVKKVIDHVMMGQPFEKTIEAKTSYYLIDGMRMAPVNSYRALQNYFADDEQMKLFLSNLVSRYRPNELEPALLEAVKHFDQLPE